MQELLVLPSRLLAIDPALVGLFVQCLKESNAEECLELLQEVDQLRFPSAVHNPRQLLRLMDKCSKREESELPQLLSEATIENLRASLESSHGYRCVAAVIAERLWQHLLSVKLRKIDRAKGFDAIISAVLAAACPSVEDIIELPTFRSMLVSAAGSQSAGIDMSCVECWRECRSIIADAQGVSSLYSKLQLLLMFARQAYSMYISQDPAEYIKQTTRLSLTNTLQKLAAIRNVREMDEDQATQAANVLLSLIKSLQLEAYGYIQSRLLPILASSSKYFEIASSLYSATSAAIMAYLEQYARLGRVSWSSLLAPCIHDDQRYVKYSTKAREIEGPMSPRAAVPLPSTMTVIVARFRYHESMQPEVSNQPLQLEEVRYQLGDEGDDEQGGAGSGQAEPISYSLLESPDAATTGQLIVELSKIARHVLNLQRRDQRQFCSLVGYYPQLLAALATVMTTAPTTATNHSPYLDSAENVLAVMEPQLLYVSMVAKSLQSTYSSPSAHGGNLGAHSHNSPNASTSPPGRGRDLTFAISTHPLLNNLRNLANTYADGDRMMLGSNDELQHYRRMLVPRLDAPEPLSFIQLLRTTEPIHGHLPVIDGPLALLLRALPTKVLVESLLLLLSGRSMIVTSLSHTLVTLAVEMLPKLCWPMICRQHRGVVLSTDDLMNLLHDAATQTQGVIRASTSMTDSNLSMPEVAARISAAESQSSSSPPAAAGADSAASASATPRQTPRSLEAVYDKPGNDHAHVPAASVGVAAAAAAAAAAATTSTNGHANGNGNVVHAMAGPSAKFLVGMHSATWKAIEVLKPRRWPRPHHQQPPSAVEVLLSQAFVLNLDLGTVESPITDDGLGFAGTDIPEFNELCAALIDLMQAQQQPTSMQDFNAQIQQKCFEFIRAVVVQPMTRFLQMYPQQGVIAFDERSFLASVSERQRHFYHLVSRSPGFAAFLSTQARALHTEDLQPQENFCEAEIHLLAKKYS